MRRHRPPRRAVARVGTRRRRRRVGAICPHRGRGRRPRGERGEAPERVLRTLRRPWGGRAGAGHRRVASRRRDRAAGRQARRHRVDEPGLRRRLPRPLLAPRQRCHHRESLPRFWLDQADDRHRPTPRRRRLRPCTDVQQGGPRGAARAHRRRGHGGRDDARPSRAGQRRRPAARRCRCRDRRNYRRLR